MARRRRVRPQRTKKTAVRPGASRQLRIIGGQWRGRRLAFPDVSGLRPTPDRVRETVFNWLQGVIEGARCLDLYAGSGALGFEAASRGAGQVVLVDADTRVATRLREHVTALGAEQIEVVHASAQSYLATTPEPFDIVFLDPPFRQGLLAEVVAMLGTRTLLKPGGYVYMEAEAELGEPALPDGWELVRSKKAGDVGYHLAVVRGERS